MRPIDADALTEELKKAIKSGKFARNHGIFITASLPWWYDKLKSIVEKQPTVEAVPVVHGRWVPLEYDSYADGNPVWDLWECSECGEEHSGDEDTLTPYCPNCGAKMDLEG